MNSALRFFVTSLILVGPTVGLAQERLELPQALSLALERNAELRLAEAEKAAALAELQGASVLLAGNPEVSGAAGPRQGPSGTSLDFEVGLSQSVELFGTRGARIDAARARLAAAEARSLLRRIEIAAELREAFTLALADKESLTIAEDGRQLAAQSLKAAEERFAAGATSRIDLNVARVELARATRERARAAQRLVLAVAEVQLLVAMDPREGVELVGALPAVAHPPEALESLVSRAEANRPDLAAVRAELEAARWDSTLAGRELWPVPRLGVTYGQEEAARIVQGTLAFELPVFNQNQARRGVAAARVTQAERSLEALQRQVSAQVRVAVARYQAASGAVQAYAGEASAAVAENLELINEAYRAGKVDFTQLLVVRRQALEERQAAVDVREELGLADAQLKRAIGSVE